MNYTVTDCSHPLSEPQEANDISKAFKTVQHFDAQDQAVEFFLKQCERLDTGCVQLWDGQREAGKLYL